MQPQQMAELWNGLGLLREVTFMWPEPQDLLAEGSKLATIEIIRASSASIGEEFPNTSVIENPDEDLVKGISAHKDMCVLKHEYSGDSKHVFYPGKVNASTRFRELRKIEKKVYGGGQVTAFPTPQWFIQPFMPAFIILGEIRAYFVNGALYNLFSTTPLEGDSTHLEVSQSFVVRPSNLYQSVRSLFLKCTLLTEINFTRLDSESVGPNVTKKTWLTAPDLSKDLVEKDYKFEVFALKMLSKLIPAEEFCTKRRSGMRIFVRVDASVFRAGGRTHFVISELTRSHETGMLLYWDTHNRNEHLFQELARVLHYATVQDQATR